MMKSKQFLYSDEVDKEALKKLLLNNRWEYDIPGFITNEQLKYAITNQYILPKKSMLNDSTPMDAQNYYIQTGDMTSIDQIIERLND